MKVHIKESLYIESDSKQFILKRYTGKQGEKGNELFITLGFFGSLASVIKYLIKMETMESEATTLKDLLVDIERIEREINRLIKV